MTTTPSGPTKEEIIKIINESKISYNFHFKLNENNIVISCITYEFPYRKYLKEYTLDELIEVNKYFSLSETLEEAFCSLLDKFKKEEKEITEVENQVKIEIKTNDKLVKHFIFVIPYKKSGSEIIDELQDEIKQLKIKDENNKTEIKKLKDDILNLTGYNFESVILSQADKDKLRNLIEPDQNKNKNLYFKLIYRRGDNYSFQKFHSQCDYQGPTIVVCKALCNTFGGYSNFDWESNDPPVSKYDKGPFIFSLTNNVKYEYAFPTDQKDKNSVYLYSCYGPDFCWDLTFNTSNGMRTCICSPFAYSSSKPLVGNGSRNNNIEVDEVEVFKVKNLNK